MEKQFPKNVRQIGNVSDSPKIYVEDYVDTFFNQMCEGDEPKAAGAFLIGHQVTIEDQPCVYISGAVQMDELPMKGAEPVIDDEVMKGVREEKEKYFHDGEIIGWFLAIPGQQAKINENIIKIHEKTFPKTNTVFVIRDTAAKEEMFFAYKYHDLLEIGGHYIYYEKNPDMQNYMITRRRQNGVTPSEDAPDQAAKNFRSVVRERMNQEAVRKPRHVPAAAGMFLILIAAVIGISFAKNYDKIRAVQNSIAMLAQAAGEKEELKKGGGQVETDMAETADDMKEIKEPETDIPEDQESGSGEQQPEEAPVSDGEGEETPPEEASDSASGGTIMQDEAVEASAGADAVLTEEDFYIVHKGDTLDSISRKLYGDTSHVEAICRMNGLEDGNLIFIGQKILLP